MPIKYFPTGVIQYNPEKAWNGYTLLPSTLGMSLAKGACLIDMNGNIVNRWQGLFGAFDSKMLKGGDVLGALEYSYGYWLDCTDLSQLDWEGNLVWRFDRAEELVNKKTGGKFWSARAHHDFQREGLDCGYYAPGQEGKRKGKTLINSTKQIDIPDLCPIPIADSWLIEVDENNNIIWDWLVTDHWNELGVDPIAAAVFSKFHKSFKDMNYVKEFYCNAVAYLGPNKWYDNGDHRFHPDNIIADIRNLNCSFIIDKKTKKIVWRLGPDFNHSKELQEIGQIVGQHQVHMIPKGLPGEGNILIFDNGGAAGMGKPTPCRPTGHYNCTRGYSRVIEVDPVSLKIVWGYNREKGKDVAQHLAEEALLYSAFCAGMDRLPNGNTLITETFSGRAIEVTPEGEIVWEYYSPGRFMFRTHRYPYDWTPIEEKPEEIPIKPPVNKDHRVTPDGKIEYAKADDWFVDEGSDEVPGMDTWLGGY